MKDSQLVAPFPFSASFFSMFLFFGGFLISSQQVVFSQNSSLPIKPEIKEAYARNTRASSGKPGEAYFQNRSDYQIWVDIEPESRVVTGREIVTYTNNSPDDLDQLVVRLYQDMYKKGFEGDYSMPNEARTDGVKIAFLSIDGDTLSQTGENPSVKRKGTNMFVHLPSKLKSGTSLKMEIAWQFIIPKDITVRMGTYGTHSYFLAYWFPQISVYDDVYGWDVFDYTGLQEFYNDFGDFEVAVTVPDSFIVWGTGVLQNPDKVLTPKYLDRYKAAHTSDSVIQIVSGEDYLDSTLQVAQPNGTNTWTFKAEYVPDFAFCTSDFYHWDATSAVVDSAGRRVFVDACYKKEAKDFYHVAKFSKDILEYMSMELPGIPYPYPKMTIFNGEMGGGGMEYPMMVNDASSYSLGAAYGLTYHEIAHSYFPFYMGINERRYAWMDEGWASFFPVDEEIRRGYSNTPLGWDVMNFTMMAQGNGLRPLMTPSIELSGRAYSVASYAHPAIAYYMLREAMGEDLFKTALQTYMKRWNGKHPIPYDFFNSFNDVAGEDMSWFWKPWFFETHKPDLGLKIKKIKRKVARFSIENKGGLPVPAHVVFTFEDGSTSYEHYSPAIWKDGVKTFDIDKKFTQPVIAIELGDFYIPDAKIGNNKWKK